jgi:hypothetical protein
MDYGDGPVSRFPEVCSTISTHFASAFMQLSSTLYTWFPTTGSIEDGFSNDWSTAGTDGHVALKAASNSASRKKDIIVKQTTSVLGLFL